MKAIITVGVISGVVLYVFFRTYSKRMGLNLGGSPHSLGSSENDTEGYFYHAGDRTLGNA